MQVESILKQLLDAGIDRELAGVLEAVAENEAPVTEQPCEYELQPEFDEAYNGVLIFTKTAQEFASLATFLELGKTMNRKGQTGRTHVVHAKKFFDLWKSKS